ncbi:MAG: hypothetical protein ABSC54_01145 [Smithellaceae bacterium]|jgi:hypothetical protein
MNNKILNQNVIDRLLIAKDLLKEIRFTPIANPNRQTIARNILTSHDAAELAIAGIASHLGVTPKEKEQYLMKYFPEIAKKHNDEDVPGRSYISQLNDARVGIKHKGLFPDPKQWIRVGENTYKCISDWRKKYLSISFDDLDESDMLSDPKVKKYYDIAKEAFDRDDFKSVLKNLALALYLLFISNKALRSLIVGTPRAEDALKLSAFGVHANEFLVLQEFLPYISNFGMEEVSWVQEKYGHPANWRKDAVEFCLNTFVSIALRIQDAEWIPGTIDFDLVYEHKITALVDDVEIVSEVSDGLFGQTKRNVVRSLKKGESIRGKIDDKDNLVNKLMALKSGQTYKHVYKFTNYTEEIFGEIEADKIHVTCVPKKDDWVHNYFPDLPELEYK